MLLYSQTLSLSDLERVADRMPVKLFETDSYWTEGRRRRIKVNIRPTERGTEGDKWRKVRVDQFTGRERRNFAISWHGFYVFMAAVLELDPHAEFKTALAHWKGREDFHTRAPATANLNWGSMMFPQYAGKMADYLPSTSEMRRIACEIAGTLTEDDRPIVFGELSSAGYTQTGTLQQSKITACPHVIIALEHYRADGTCKCNDPAENIMAEWGYTWDSDLGRWN